MANERDEDQFAEDQNQQSTGQQNHQQPISQHGGDHELQPTTMSNQDPSGSAPQKSPSGNAHTVTGERSDQSGETGHGGSQAESFIGSKGGEPDEYLQNTGGASGGSSGSSSANATDGSDFAKQGRGAADENENEAGDGSNASGPDGGNPV